MRSIVDFELVSLVLVVISNVNRTLCVVICVTVWQMQWVFDYKICDV